MAPALANTAPVEPLLQDQQVYLPPDPPPPLWLRPLIWFWGLMRKYMGLGLDDAINLG